jgi:DNA-binding NarL/FixJ family response regulator
LELAIRTVMQGETYLTPAVAKFAVEAFRRRTDAEAGPLGKLTPRQREILQLIAEGHTTKDIARQLSLGVRTVETHRAELMDRLDIHDVPGLVRLAIQAGLVSSGA